MTSRRRVVLVSGLSGAGKASVLRALEDAGFSAVDNPPLDLIAELVQKAHGSIAIGVDARSSGFDADAVIQVLTELRADPSLDAELVYCWADEAVLLRRYSETRRRHPMAPDRRVADGIALESEITARLREAADFVLDTTDLPLPGMRALIERRYGPDSNGAGRPRMSVALTSFSYAHGLPRDADLVFDARFLRNPHYDPILRPKTGLDPEVAAYVAADPDYRAFMDAVRSLLDLLLPRFLQEGKKYVTIAVGCTGGRHRSVHIVESLAAHLAQTARTAYQPPPWLLHVTHRELARQPAGGEQALRDAAPGLQEV